MCEIFSMEGGGKFILYVFGENTILLVTDNTADVHLSVSVMKGVVDLDF